MNKFVLGALTGAVAAVGLQTAAVSVGHAQPAPPAPGVRDAHSCSRDQEAANKQLVMSMNPPTPDTLYANMHPDYIQHSPDSLHFMQLNNVYGKPGMALLRQAFDKLGVHYGPPPPPPAGQPVPPPPNMKAQVIAECDLVFTMSEMSLPDPTAPGKFYPSYMFDLWRIKDGKLYEHWDGMKLGNPLPPYLKAPFKDLQPTAPAS